jgi:hypothetical protein
MALVLKAREKRGAVIAFDVMRAEQGGLKEILEDIPAGDYKVMDGNTVVDVGVSYRTVQDIDIKSGQSL